MSKLHDIKGVEIFRTGTWNGDKYEADDLDEMVTNFAKVGFTPPVKLGHDAKSGERAFGWVEKIRRVGAKLVADLRDVPAEIYKLIKERGYDAISSEVYWDLERNGKKFRRALKAIALLGAETPAVAGLAPLRTIVNSDQGAFHALRTYTVHMEHNMAKDIVSLNAKVSELTANLHKALTDLERARAQASPDAAKIAALEQGAGTIRAELEQAHKDREEAYAEVATKVVDLEKNLTTANTAIATFQDERRVNNVAKAVDRLRFPALREFIAALYDIASKTTATHTYTDAAGKPAEKTLWAVIDELVAKLNDKMPRLLQEASAQGDRPASGMDSGEAADVQLDRKVREYMAKNPAVKAYADATRAVLQAEPELARAYAAQAGGRSA